MSRLGNLRYKGLKLDKNVTMREQATKILEEATELHQAVHKMDYDNILEELHDVIQAAATFQTNFVPDNHFISSKMIHNVKLLGRQVEFGDNVLLILTKKAGDDVDVE